MLLCLGVVVAYVCFVLDCFASFVWVVCGLIWLVGFAIELCLAVRFNVIELAGLVVLDCGFLLVISVVCWMVLLCLWCCGLVLCCDFVAACCVYCGCLAVMATCLIVLVIRNEYLLSLNCYLLFGLF